MIRQAAWALLFTLSPLTSCSYSDAIEHWLLSLPTSYNRNGMAEKPVVSDTSQSKVGAYWHAHETILLEKNLSIKRGNLAMKALLPEVESGSFPSISNGGEKLHKSVTPSPFIMKLRGIQSPTWPTNVGRMSYPWKSTSFEKRGQD